MGRYSCGHRASKYRCIICWPKNFCEHKCYKQYCIKCCGQYICHHHKQKSQCKECNGSQICGHNRFRSYCRECNGPQVCDHKRNRRECFICDPAGALLCRIRAYISSEFGQNNIAKISTQDILGCSTDEFYRHIRNQCAGDVVDWKSIKIKHRPGSSLHYTNYYVVKNRKSEKLTDNDITAILADYGF